VLQTAEPSDHARKQDDQQIGRIALHPWILQWSDLVERRGEPHDSFPMEVALGIGIAQGQSKGIFGLKHRGSIRCLLPGRSLVIPGSKVLESSSMA
jgi:hypothetical protein